MADQHARGGSRARVDDALAGRLLEGRYRIGSRIARGGMASVYEATDVRLDRTVAVKVMHAGLGDAHGPDGGGQGEDGDFAARFVREARSAARLSHPNVVSVFDQGEDDGIVYLAMELVAGHTLRDTIAKESPMAPGRALALLEPVVSALAAAHRAGMIHRDVKPENVLIADDGRVKVADFGLAKAISADTQHTATQGVLIGTVSYLAPELVVDGRADARADVYAVGVVLYELLTGVKPHEGETPIAVAYKHVHHDVPPPSERVPGLPPYVDALVARATARDRDLRPADAGVLLHQLHRVAHALADGVREDPELTTDLSPVLARGGADDGPEWDDLGLAAPASPTTLMPHDLLTPPGPPSLAPEPVAPRGRTRPPRPTRPRRRRRGLVLLVVALVLAVGAGAGAYWYGYGRYTAAPGVVALSKTDAEQRLADADLAVAYADPVYDRDAASGTVVTAEPAGGARLLPGDTVTLALSLGPDTVPDVGGLTAAAAKRRLRAKQLTGGDRVLRYSATVDEGTVLRSDPAAGTEIDPGTAVALVVSNGPRPIEVGSWGGKDGAAAAEALTAQGLVPDVSEAFSATVPDGRVISQDPNPGTALTAGDHVTLVVSKGQEMVEVPSVKAYGIDAATQTLTDLGFKVDVEKSTGVPGYLGLGFATSTDPEAGSMAPEGSTIVVYVI